MTFGLIISRLPAKALSIMLVMIAMSSYVTPSSVSAGIMKRVFLTSGTSWTVPADWNSSNNTIEAIGGGGSGDEGNFSGYGGGGGAYASKSNISLTPSASVNYRIGSGSTDTIFNTTATACEGFPTASVCAETGATASGADAIGGTTANSIGTTKYAGGSGGGGGGGGAGGPSADGTDGFSSGGSGNGGAGGGGGTPGEDSGSGFCFGSGQYDGLPGEEYSSIPTYGSGGGGATAIRVGFLDERDDCPPGIGGAYGGGGGGGTTWLGYSGFGGGGLLVITYESTDSGSTSNAKVKIIGGKVQIIGGRVLIR